MLDMPAAVEEQFISPLLSQDLDGEIEIVALELDKEMMDVRLIESEDQRIYLIDNRDNLIALSKKDRPSASAYISGDDISKLTYEYYIQGYESERLQNLYMIIHIEDIMTIANLASNQKVVALDADYDHLNSRESALPALLTFNGSMMGLFIIAAYIFLDRQQGIIKAYAITASRVWQYLMSQVLVLMTVTTLTTFAILLAVMGFKANYLMVILLLLPSAFFFSSLGLWVASFFTNLTQAFGAIYFLMMAFMLPAIAYFIPSWEPLWIKFLPTYYLIQGFKESIIDNGDMGFVLLASGIYLGVGIITFLLANSRFEKTLTA